MVGPDGVIAKATPEVSNDVDIVQAVQEPQQQSVAMEQKPLSFALGRMAVQQQGCPSGAGQRNIISEVVKDPAKAQQQYAFPHTLSGSYVQDALPVRHGPYPVRLLYCVDESFVRVERECLTNVVARSTSDSNPGESNGTDELLIDNNGLEPSGFKIALQVNECGVAEKIARTGKIIYERDFLLKLEKQKLSNVKSTIDIPDIAKDDRRICELLGNETVHNDFEMFDKIAKQEIIKYDRDALLKIERLPESRKRLEILIPDLFKDNTEKKKPEISKKPERSYVEILNDDGSLKNFKRERSSKYQNVVRHMNGLNTGEMYYKPLPNVPIAWPMMLPPPPPMEYFLKIMESKSEITLHKAKNPWKRKPTGYTPEENNEEQLIEDLGRTTRGILNKLMPHNFDAIAESFKILPVNDSQERILKFLEVVFGAVVAVTEPLTTEPYAQLVQEVCKNCPETLRMYQKELTTQCRREFQKLTSHKKELRTLENELMVDGNVEKKQLKLEVEFKKYWLRRRSLGFVIFIGDLYQRQMLSQHIVIEYVNMFVCSPDEENLECLCKLLYIVGKKLDESLREQLLQLQRYEAKNLELLFRQEGKYMDKMFDKLNTLSQQNNLSLRIRCLLMNVVELRENDWTNRHKVEIDRMAIQNQLEKALGIKSFVHFGGGDSRSTYHKSESSWNMPKNNQSTTFISKKPKQIAKSDSPFLSRRNTTAHNPFTQGMQKSEETIEQKRADGFTMFNPNHKTNAQLALDVKQRKKNRITHFEGINNITQLSIRERMDRVKHKMSTDAGFASFLPPPPPPRFLRFQELAKRNVSSPNINVSNLQSNLLEPQDSSKPEYNGENAQPLSSMDVPATLKSFLMGFKERKKNEKLGETVFWIRSRFEGDDIYIFVEELSRQICYESDEYLQTETGAMVRFLLKYNFVKLDGLIKTLVKGFVQDLPNIYKHQPEAITNVGKYLAEVFFESRSTDWLIDLSSPLLLINEIALAMRLVQITGEFMKKRNNEKTF